MGNWGMKVFKKGADENSVDPRDLLMSSKYTMLKYHSEHNVYSTLTPGDYSSYVDIPHNLGYVPAFMAYYKDLSGNFRYIPGLPDGIGFDSWAYAYATNEIIRVGVEIATTTDGYNQIIKTAVNSWNTTFNNDDYCIMGDVSGTNSDGALRFTNVTLAQGASIVSGTVDLWVWDKGSGVGNLDVNHYGIDEDNTAAWTVDSPMGRTTTTASGNLVRTVPSLNTFMNIPMTNQIQEIVNRPGWASGNAMGFIIRDNGSANNVYAADTVPSTSTLTITYGSALNIYYKVIIFKDKIF